MHNKLTITVMVLCILVLCILLGAWVIEGLEEELRMEREKPAYSRASSPAITRSRIAWERVGIEGLEEEIRVLVELSN